MGKILVTGGAGYIGSHTCIQLVEAGYDVVVVDNMCNCHREGLKRAEEIAGASIPLVEADVRDGAALKKVFNDYDIDAVIHFAGLKAVGESVEKPLEYYDNNLTGTIQLLLAMKDADVKNIVFSSSATVYGDPASLPITEDFPLSVTNPYGRSKLVVEDMLRDTYLSDNAWNVALLRYFNPVGAHKSGLIGEDPNGIPNNLMPFISQTAVGKREKLRVFGDDYDTPDGTGVRDYIHVEDLAAGHIAAVKKLEKQPGLVTYNLGTGHGYSVLDMVKAFEKASGKTVAYEIVERRGGDIAACYADATLAKNELAWEASRGVEEMCEDTWRWQSNNPNGFMS